MHDVPDLRQFVSQCLDRHYASVPNLGWMKQLVFGSDPAAVSALRADLLAGTRGRR